MIAGPIGGLGILEPLPHHRTLQPRDRRAIRNPLVDCGCLFKGHVVQNSGGGWLRVCRKLCIFLWSVSTCIAPVCTYALHGSRAFTASHWHLFDAHLEGKSARNSVSGRSSVVGVLRRSARALKKDHGDDPRQLPQQRTALCAACNQPGRNSAGSYAQQLLATFLQNQSGKTSFPMQWAPEAWHALGTACCHFVFVLSW